MNVRKTLSVVVVLSLLLGGLGAAHAATTLPYAQSFDSGYTSADPLTDGSGGTVQASVAAKLTGTDGQGLEILNDTVTLNVQDATYANVWIQVYMKPVKGDPEDLEPNVTGQTGAFYINSIDNKLWANNGGIWQAQDGQLFENNKYYGFIVHANYVEGEYDIYSNNGTFKANMTRLNTDPLAFIPTTATHIDTVSIQSGELAYVDALAVSRAFQAPGLANWVAVYEHQASDTALRKFQMPVYSDRYTGYTGEDPNEVLNRSLHPLAPLGNDILSGLVDGDKINVWSDSDEDTYDLYYIANGIFVKDAFSKNAKDPADASILTMTSMQIQQVERDQTFGFYSYNNSAVIALGGAIQPSAGSYSETFVLNGTDKNGQGWTPLNWGNGQSIASLPFTDTDCLLGHFQNGDRMFISHPDSPNAWTMYEWTGTPTCSWLRRVGAIPHDPVPPGANMWVKRQNGPQTSDITAQYNN